ncbi:MAG TPA: hypothetical protein VJB14_05510 [Planctomycetota bacterium]|nr:hypothetical protein [Planctomycetota bacterium]
MRTRIAMAALVVLVAAAGAIAALGTPQAGGAAVQLLAIKFDAEGTLYAADAKNNQIASYGLADKKGKLAPVQVPDLGAQLAKALSCGADEVVIHDIAAHPTTFAVFLSVGKKGTPESRLFKVGADRKVVEVAVGELKKAAVKLPDGTQPFDIAVTAKNVILSSTGRDRTFSSELHRVPLPLAEGKMLNAQTELYHASHKAWETKAPLVAMTAFTMGGKEYIVGATKCTPVVRIPVDEIGDKAKVKTTTIIELGGGNSPVSMMVYGQGPNQSLILTHLKSAQEGAYKVSPAVLAEGTKVNEKAPNRGGKNAESIAAWKNAKKAALLGPTLAVAVIDQGGSLSLVTLPLP